MAKKNSRRKNKETIIKPLSKKIVPKSIIVISDTHIGCKLGLCPPEFRLDENNIIRHSDLQAKVWEMWQEFWNEWVPMVTKGEPYIVVHNGDVIDGVHHNAVTTITNNFDDQIRLADQVLRPIVTNSKCAKYFQIRGTEAHTGNSGQYEENLARNLGAVPDRNGNYARWNMWLRMLNGSLIHFTHHVGTTNSAAYESTAVYKELTEAFNEAGRSRREPPTCVVRSHRHRAMEIKVPVKGFYGYSICTPGWQLRTPFVWRTAMGRSGTPQIGGYCIRVGGQDGLYTRFKIWDIERDPEEVITDEEEEIA